MLRQKNYLALGLLGCVLLLLSATTADDSVFLLSKYGQQLTSTTLKWLPSYQKFKSKQIVVGGFEKIPNAEGTVNSRANRAAKSLTGGSVGRAVEISCSFHDFPRLIPRSD